LAAKYHVHLPQQHITGTIQLDGSKSISNRVLIIRALSQQSFPIHQLSSSDDTKAMQAALTTTQSEVNVGAAGTTMRFLTAYYACQPNHTVVLTGSARMKQRPIGVLVNALQQLGADISYLETTAYPPLLIKGKRLTGGTVRINASVSSQYLSALLMIAPTLVKGLRLELVGKLVSRPYLAMTLRVMETFGVQHQWEGNTISIAPQTYQAKPFTVEADWSAASYYYAIAALGKPNKVNITLKGLHPQSLQGDSALRQLMTQFGVQSRFDGERLILEKKPLNITHFRYNFIECPDIAQTLSVVGAALGVSGELAGLITLAIKETDRTAALHTELAKMGVVFEGSGDVWHLKANAGLHPPSSPIKTYHDHRMAMAFAPLGLVLPAGITIEEPMVVTKSYPLFWEDLKRLGFVVTPSTSC